MSFNPSFGQTDSAPDTAAAKQALLVVSPDGQIQFATAQAGIWMRDLSMAASPLDRLPEALIRWLSDRISGGLPSRFILDRAGSQLCIRILGREARSICLLLEESPEVLAYDGRHRALTERETEVLAWVARGKANADIGQIMGLKTGTIGKYLERIFMKLRVENRTAAASFALGTNGAI